MLPLSMRPNITRPLCRKEFPKNMLGVRSKHRIFHDDFPPADDVDTLLRGAETLTVQIVDGWALMPNGGLAVNGFDVVDA